MHHQKLIPLSSSIVKRSFPQISTNIGQLTRQLDYLKVVHQLERSLRLLDTVKSQLTPLSIRQHHISLIAANILDFFTERNHTRKEGKRVVD